jgi:hypothetical protein
MEFDVFMKAFEIIRAAVDLMMKWRGGGRTAA